MNVPATMTSAIVTIEPSQGDQQGREQKDCAGEQLRGDESGFEGV